MIFYVPFVHYGLHLKFMGKTLSYYALVLNSSLLGYVQNTNTIINYKYNQSTTTATVMMMMKDDGWLAGWWSIYTYVYVIGTPAPLSAHQLLLDAHSAVLMMMRKIWMIWMNEKWHRGKKCNNIRTNHPTWINHSLSICLCVLMYILISLCFVIIIVWFIFVHLLLIMIVIQQLTPRV